VAEGDHGGLAEDIEGMRPLSVIARESMEPLRAVVRGRWRDERYGLRRKEGWVSRISDAKSRVQHLLHLSARIRSQVTRLGGPEGRVFKEKAKEGAKRMGIGAAVALFGAAVVAVAAVYILAVLILYYFMSARRVAVLQRDIELLENEAKRRETPAPEAE